MNWYVEVLKKYAVFTGRAGRTEYWMFFLFNLIIVVAIGIVERILGIHALLEIIYGLAVVIPGIAVGVRRMHDTDRTGWWLLIGLVPVIGAIVVIVLLAMAGTQGDNQYGSPPAAA
jgi:uncharacterized membrane protein YhaH (DUF805 family)